MQQTKKVDSALVTSGEESFEFAPVRPLDGDRFVSNVQNHSHDDGETHIYPVYFRVDQDETGVSVEAVECGCPADEYHSGPCKHREAAAECAALLAAVLAVALDSDDESEEEEESAAVDGKKEQSGRTAIADGGRAVGEWANRGGMPCPERMSAAMELALRWEIEYDEAKAHLQGVGFLEDGGGNEKKLVTDGGTDVPHDCPNDPERRNIHGEPICDECGMVVVDPENSDFGGGCLCQGCQDGFRREREREFGEGFITEGGR